MFLRKKRTGNMKNMMKENKVKYSVAKNFPAKKN